jgi:DNA invertase Pin-like site-specific DNA recombinase
MTIYAYIQVSDVNKQTTAAQKYAINRYVKANQLILEPKNVFVREISGSNSSEALWDEIISLLKDGDTLLMSDIDRVGRGQAIEVISLFDQIILKGVTLIFCQTNTVFSPDRYVDPSVIFMLMGEAYAAVRYTEKRSTKAKAVCEQRASNNLRNGRKKGEFVKSKLDEHEFEIITALAEGENKSDLSKKYSVCRSTLYRWIETRDRAKEVGKELGIEADNIGELKRLIRQY